MRVRKLWEDAETASTSQVGAKTCFAMHVRCTALHCAALQYDLQQKN